MNAIVYNAIPDAGRAKDAEIFNNADFSGRPVKGVGGTSFDAQLTLHSFAGVFVDTYAPFLKIFLYPNRLEELGSPLELPPLDVLFPKGITR